MLMTTTATVRTPAEEKTEFLSSGDLDEHLTRDYLTCCDSLRIRYTVCHLEGNAVCCAHST